jgi:hypothetical protein
MSNENEPKEEPKEKPEKKPIGEALIISFATAFAYVCAFFYEWGFVIYYRIPVSWIEIELNRLITIGAGSSLSMMTIGGILVMIFPRFSECYPRFSYFLGVVIASLLIGFVVFIFVYTCLEWGVLSSIYIGAIMTVLSGIVRYLIGKKLNAGKIRSFLGGYGLTFRQVLFVLLVPVILFSISFLRASTKETFLVRAGTKNTIVVKQYGDTFIEEKYNPSTLTLNDTIIITKTSEPSYLSAKRIGHLKSKSF